MSTNAITSLAFSIQSGLKLSFTRQSFEEIARHIATEIPKDERKLATNLMLSSLPMTSPRFNEIKFKKMIKELEVK